MSHVLPTQYQSFIHLSRYSRWRDHLGRRESWGETVGRYFDFFERHLSERCGVDVSADRPRLEEAVLSLQAMPSMRCMMMAGDALRRDEVGGYNCTYRAIDHPHAFDEIMYVLLCGTGAGFSVERQYVGQLPMVPRIMKPSTYVVSVQDSRLGWVKAFRKLLEELWKGREPTWDVSRVRPAGARLKTTGGYASGPGPLVDLFQYTIALFKRAAGRRLSSLECHDLVCKIGDVVVVGGVRRSALISLSNLSDLRMRGAKAGNWWETAPHRMLANNSVAYTERPEVGQFMDEWKALYDSKSGERGMFNRQAAVLQAGKSGRRRTHWDDEGLDPVDFGVNPCSEIILRNAQCCNLSEVVARSDDDFEALRYKAEVAATLGTWQATLTKFRHLSKPWTKNCEEERLLGVSLTGIMDCPLLSGGTSYLPAMLRELKAVTVATNAEWAERLKIPVAAAITCVKPSGTVSQLVNSSSGIHPRRAKGFIRRVRMDNKDPLTEFMVNSGFVFEPDVMKPLHMTVFEFPSRAPEGAVLRGERDAIQNLEHWKVFQDHWCEHKPSITVDVKEHEWPRVGAWVWDHFDQLSGVAFLPDANVSSYRQLPEEEVDESRLQELEAQIPKGVDWSGLSEFERVDSTKGTRELACHAGQCELV